MGDTKRLRSSPTFARLCLPDAKKERVVTEHNHSKLPTEGPVYGCGYVTSHVHKIQVLVLSFPPKVGRKRHVNSDSFNLSAPAPASQSCPFKPLSFVPFLREQPFQTLSPSASYSSLASPHPDRPSGALAPVPASRLVRALTDPRSSVEKARSAAVQ